MPPTGRKASASGNTCSSVRSFNWFPDLLHQLRPQHLLRDLLDSRVLNSELVPNGLEKSIVPILQWSRSLKVPVTVRLLSLPYCKLHRSFCGRHNEFDTTLQELKTNFFEPLELRVSQLTVILQGPCISLRQKKAGLTCSSTLSACCPRSRCLLRQLSRSQAHACLG